MSQQQADEVVYLSQATFDHLQEEMARLVAERPAIADEINARREEGDLRENAGYHAAREEQAKREGRIKQLDHLLKTAIIGEAPKELGKAGPGMVLTVRYEDDDDVETFLLAPREEMRVVDIDVYSPQSPLGKALSGATEGEIRDVPLPKGGTMRVHLVKVEPHTPRA